VDSEKPVQVGIAGLGRSGWSIHAAMLAELPEYYRIVAACDPEEARRKEAAERFGCRTYADYEGLLGDRDVELMIVALPTHLHAEASIQALQAGKAVVCEKPMAANLADADRVIAVAQETGGLLTVFQNRRYAPDFLKVREVIASGVLGRIVLVHMTSSGFGRRWDWQTLKEYGGGTLNNNGVHNIDQALLLFGEGQPQIFCHLERTLTLGDAEDHVKVILYGPGKPMIDIELSAACAIPQEAWHVMGTLGGLAGSAQALRWRTIDPSALPPRSVDRRPTPDRSYNSEAYEWHEGHWDISEYNGPGQSGFYLDLFATLRQGKPLAVTPESVRRVMWVLEECHRLSPV
jgi:scyllo-inositol 2-dehydrogenase (NADP+)